MTPESTSRENVLLELREIRLSDNGPATVIEKTQPTGVFESHYRAFYADKPDKDTRDGLTGYVKAQYIADKLTSVERTDPGDLSTQFELTLQCDKAQARIYRSGQCGCGNSRAMHCFSSCRKI